jgi:hypothetical protein
VGIELMSVVVFFAGVALFVTGFVAGYWRVGCDSLGSWPNAPTSNVFAGSVAAAGIFDRVLTADEGTAQYTAGR